MLPVTFVTCPPPRRLVRRQWRRYGVLRLLFFFLPESSFLLLLTQKQWELLFFVESLTLLGNGVSHHLVVLRSEEPTLYHGRVIGLSDSVFGGMMWM